MHWYDLTELLPPVFRKIKSMFSAAFAENTELLQFRAYLREIRDNFFIQTCDEQTLQYWESLLNIKLYGGETINERRNMIILHLTNNQAITILYARKVMNDLFGKGNYELFYDQATPYIIYITIFDTDLSKLETFLYWFEEVCPAHIQWNAGHTENADTEFEIYAGSQSDYDVVETIESGAGTETLYQGTSGQSYQYVIL